LKRGESFEEAPSEREETTLLLGEDLLTTSIKKGSLIHGGPFPLQKEKQDELSAFQRCCFLLLKRLLEIEGSGLIRAW